MRQAIEGDGPFVLVDDSLLDADLVERCLSKAPLNRDFVFLESGDRLLAYMDGVLAKANPMPCVILLDVNMPRMDGFQALSAIREVPEFHSRPPINLFSGAELSESEQEAIRNRAGYIMKPMSVDELSDILMSLGQQ